MVRQAPASSVIQRRQLGSQSIDVVHVCFADWLDLPIDRVETAISTRVAGVTFERSVLGMDVELDAPPGGGNAKVDVHDNPAGTTHHPCLTLDGHTALAQRLGEDDLGMRLRRSLPAETLQRLLKALAAVATWMTQLVADGQKLVDRNALHLQ